MIHLKTVLILTGILYYIGVGICIDIYHGKLAIVVDKVHCMD